MTYYLYENENPHAPRRDNGRRFWGYPQRNGAAMPDVIVIHTAENIPDIVAPDIGGENVANYLATTSRPASAHWVGDSDSEIELLPPWATAFHVRGYNTRGLGAEIATRAASWDKVPAEFAHKLMIRTAVKVAEWCTIYGIPPIYRTRQQIDRGLPGITSHSQLDPTRRSDPGFTANQWSEFQRLVEDNMASHLTPAQLEALEFAELLHRSVTAGLVAMETTAGFDNPRPSSGSFGQYVIYDLRHGVPNRIASIGELADALAELAQAVETQADLGADLERRVTQLENTQPGTGLQPGTRFTAEVTN